jgi:hypothetical protein
VFTPVAWARWAAEATGLVDAWLNGANVFDPQCGIGQLLAGLVAAAQARGLRTRDLPWQRLWGADREPAYLRVAARTLGLCREQLLWADTLTAPPALRVERVFANPPWVNFPDLPAADKSALKPQFVALGLVPDRRRVLLGGTRIDVAALAIARYMERHLLPHGQAVVFLPLSVFQNDGAHAAWRNFAVGPVRYAPTAVVDLTAARVFPDIQTRYGLAVFVRDRSFTPPIPWANVTGWTTAGPSGAANAAWTIGPHARPTVHLPARPRQGVNTGGANAVLHVALAEPAAAGQPVWWVQSARGRWQLPAWFLYPLLAATQFATPTAPPRRWVVLPYHPTGRVLSAAEVSAAPLLAAFLHAHADVLQARKGVWLRRGPWWSLVGVGPYCFTPWKVAWPAYGATTFTPQVFGAVAGQPWQANQAAQAFVPCADRAEAEAVAAQLRTPAVAAWLSAFQTAGTRSWAQPGRIAALMAEESPPC